MSYTPQVQARPAPARPATPVAVPAAAGRDADGDNDGTKGRSVDIRA